MKSKNCTTGQEAYVALNVRYKALGEKAPKYDWADPADYGEYGKPTMTEEEFSTQRDTFGNLREGMPRGVQKSANVNYPNAAKDVNATFAGNLREGMGNRRKTEAQALIERKRPDLKGDAARLVEEIAKFKQPKEQKAALHWVIAGSIRLPEDAYKVTEAIEYGERAKGKGETDAMKYKSPMEMVDALHEFKPKAKPIDPDTVPELSDKQDLGHGITTYLVQDDKDGQLAMRKIINTHWGEDANPWCLLCGDGKGNLFTDYAWDYWQQYSALPKRVAFKNGKLLAFMATEGEELTEYDLPSDLQEEYEEDRYYYSVKDWLDEFHPNDVFGIEPDAFEEWWDRQDKSHPDLDWAIGDTFGNLREGSYTPSAEEIARAKREYDEVVAQYKGTDKWLKAANGKKSNLTERQWVQVRTPSFKKWFGDWENDPENASKMIDENGEPRVYYHGTEDGGFSEFHDDFNWFTPHIFSAATYSNRNWNFFELPTTIEGVRNMLPEGYSVVEDDEYEGYRVLEPDGTYATDVHDDIAELVDDIHTNILGREGIYPVFLNIRNPREFEAEGKAWYDIGYEVDEETTINDADELVGFFYRMSKYDHADGVIIYTLKDPGRTGDDDYQDQIVAFNPNQIKFTDNIGTFDNRTNIGNLREAMPKGLSKRQRAVLWQQFNEKEAYRYTKNAKLNNRNVINSDKYGLAYDRTSDDNIAPDELFQIDAEPGKLTAYQEVLRNGIERTGKTFSERAKKFGVRIGDGSKNLGGTSNGEARKGDGEVDGLAYRDLRRLSKAESLSESPQDNSSGHSNGNGVDKNLPGNLREGDLDEHLQARREAMPKMGLEAARANVQAALKRGEGESRKAWAKRKAKAIADFTVEKMVDARAFTRSLKSLLIRLINHTKQSVIL